MDAPGQGGRCLLHPLSGGREVCRGRCGNSIAILGHPPRPTRPAGAPDLRVALESPAATQAEKVANAFRPPIDGVRRCPAIQMRHLSVFEDAVCAE
jgi:hypothetical protein